MDTASLESSVTYSESLFFAFDVPCSLTVAAFPGVEEALDSCVAECQRFEEIFSHTRSTSELSRLNGALGMPVSVDPQLADLLRLALDYCAATEGLFDITAGELAHLWNFHQAQMPTSDDIRRARSHTDFRQVHVNGQVVCIDDAAARVVLGGIAKGYIADKLRDALRAAGIRSAAIDLGGDIAVLGARPDGKPWEVLVADPRTAAGNAAFVLARDAAVVTSGVYERFFEEVGKRFHHIVDPRTGYPAQSDLVAVSVIARDALDGDGYSTALLIMGLRCAYKFVEAHDGIEALFFREKGAPIATSGLRHMKAAQISAPLGDESHPVWEPVFCS